LVTTQPEDARELGDALRPEVALHVRHRCRLDAPPLVRDDLAVGAGRLDLVDHRLLQFLGRRQRRVPEPEQHAAQELVLHAGADERDGAGDQPGEPGQQHGGQQLLRDQGDLGEVHRLHLHDGGFVKGKGRRRPVGDAGSRYPSSKYVARSAGDQPP